MTGKKNRKRKTKEKRKRRRRILTRRMRTVKFVVVVGPLTLMI